MENIATKENIKQLVEGKLPWDEVKKLLRLSPKDADRFSNYLEVLQEKVPWKDKILLRLTDHLYIVAKEGGGRMVKCSCGQEFSDYRINWKLSCNIYVRRTQEEMAEVIPLVESVYDPTVVELREYYCPGCMVLLSVEVVPRGYPPVFDLLPDLDTLYREWLGEPLPDEQPDWFQDRSSDLTAQWAKE
ncbi:MAG: acetone carboxylase subunit gamma [Dehalococcoidales bacterium]|nr:acetone carboxylase subunit gamma [Dehalococcoidales bacterium]